MSLLKKIDALAKHTDQTGFGTHSKNSGGRFYNNRPRMIYDHWANKPGSKIFIAFANPHLLQDDKRENIFTSLCNLTASI